MKWTLSVAALLMSFCLVSTAQVPSSSHVFVVVDESHSYQGIVGNSNLPYLNSLAKQYGLATQYYANTHPAIGNYFTMTCGQLVSNSSSYTGTVTADNIVRELMILGKTWKAYADGLPSVGYTGGDTGYYVKSHNPFVYLSDVVNSSTEHLNVVPFTQFATDLANNTLPNLSFIIPNKCNAGAACSTTTADNWLKTNIAPLLASPTFRQDGILILTFDQSISTDTTNGGGRVATIVIGPKVKSGYSSSSLYQHQSLLKTVLKALGATTFPGAAATAPAMDEFFTTVASTPSPVVTLSPTGIAFGSQTVGTVSTAQTATLANNGTAALTISSAVTSSNFAISAKTCSTTLAAGSKCTISATFKPSTTGVLNGSLSVSTSSGTQNAALSGTGTSTVVPTTTTTTGTQLPYLATSPWNTAISASPTISVNNSSYIAQLTGIFGSDPTQYTYPVFIIDSSVPVQSVTFSGVYKELQSSGGVNTKGTIQIPVPAGATQSAGLDGEIIIWNPATGDEWGMIRFSGTKPYTATNGYHYNTNWSAVVTGTRGPRGAGVPYLAGLIRKWEVLQGHIDHAIAFGFQNTGTTFVYPASGTDGQHVGGIPEGSRLQLDPRLTDTDFTAWGLTTTGKIIARAMQKYGMIVVDTSGHPKVYAEDSTTANWGTMLTAGTVSKIPLSKFRVVQ